LAVLGELGMIPCSVDAIKLSVSFWHHVVNSKGTSLIRKVYDTIPEFDIILFQFLLTEKVNRFLEKVF
jgi:hypothetical protein